MPENREGRKYPKRTVELDGIRGLAIAMVVYSHYFVGNLPVALKSWQAYAMVPFRLAWSGVDLFFVLSGFLIGGILLDARTSDRYYGPFYWRRAYRIIPPYYALLLSCFLGLYLTGNAPSDLRAVFRGPVPIFVYVCFLQNIFMVVFRTFGAEWLVVTWSLAVEEQFYLILPAVVRRANTKQMFVLTISAIATAPLVRFLLVWTGNGQFGPGMLLPSRMDAFGFGILLALACRNAMVRAWLVTHKRVMLYLFICLGAGCIFLTVRPQYINGFGLTWICAFYASMLTLVVVTPGRITGRIFRAVPLARLGRIAYGVYLLHAPVLIMAHFLIRKSTPKICDLWAATVTMMALVVVILVCEVSWKFIEEPMMQYARSRHPYVPAS